MRTLFHRGLLSAWLVFCASSLHGQERSASNWPRQFVHDAGNVLAGTGHVLSNPLRWRSKDWAIFGSVLAGTFAISFADEEVNRFFQRNQSRTGDKLASFGVQCGEPRTAVLLTGGLYLSGLVLDSDWLRETCVTLSASLLASGAVQYPVKIASGRARPHVGRGHKEFDFFHGAEAYSSFFSGHAMVAMVFSHTLARRLQPLPAKLLLYSVGTLGGAARLYGEDHWLSDVTLGAIFAIANVNSAAQGLAEQRSHSQVGSRQWCVFASARGLHTTVAW
ncbi:MAG: phosphatase PAP2 family protein [candidate division KSB1 bacterium]|nr:phosphatase PAP2 family protein [candidate division KSB1 bacterium]MDZ7272697.1 phosphatase PAP2 family protein [candidate division KSB1 bacterium]MDZ7284280.1 phosphatase PAP2 family protein [candidate division KSB1 bacterium]MDZ7297324.1 phosphatase PAP2 family protein [candidate division KSB1 bacterium]MDZ7308392.1 phosphatase PAP2 family protein [candidate division KSB1 bacterium]